ncbi:MAG: hypothetical protein KatS3mg087_1443 [Patescibacteria group bacterium]|nr:MAG: hypothetical protein KatS3mg087_1443 [Patescibacteria group bacterium]
MRGFNFRHPLMQIVQYYQKVIAIPRWKLNIFGLICLTAGLITGAYFLTTNLVSRILAAGDTTFTWDSTGSFTAGDTSKLELNQSSTISRLSVQNYTSDADTATLFHFDESSGNPADSSSNSNSASATALAYVTGNLNNAADYNGNSSYVSVNDSSSLSITGTNTLEAWVKFDNSLSAGSLNQRQVVFDKGQYQLYFDNETGKLTYELADSSATTWTQVAGNESNNSWDADGHLEIAALINDGANVYAGIGNGTGDAEVWQWNGSTWSKIGGDAVNSSWSLQTYESVLALANDGTTYVYAALGTGTGDGEVWRYTTASQTWTRIGGDGVNSSWTAGTFEGAYALNFYGGNLYAGLGNSANDADVWRWNGTSWTQIGGDSLNSGWTTGFEQVYSLTNDGTNLYAGLGNTAGDAEVWRWNGTAWTRIGGDAINSSWANTTYEYVFSMDYFGGNLYAGLGLTANDAEVWRWNGTSWTQIGGDSLNSGWTTNYEGVYSLTNDGTNLYAGLGNTGGDDEVWRWNGTAWTKIGGDGVNSGYTSTTHTIVQAMTYMGSSLFMGHTSGNAGTEAEVWTFTGSTWARIGGNYVNNSWGFRGFQTVENMTVSGENLYAGMGSTNAGNAMVMQFDNTAWSPIGGAGLNSSWTPETYEAVLSMISYNGNLHVGLGTTAGDAEVWRYISGTWTQIGGDSLNSGWTTGFEEVSALAVDNTYLYAGLGNSAGDAEVWRWDGISWLRIGGDAINSSWANSTYERVSVLAIFNGQLYAGLGASAGDAEVWVWNGSNAWTRIGGDAVNSSWANTTYEQVDTMIPYNNRLYAGLGQSAGDAEVWEYNGSSWTQVGGDDLNSSWTTGTYERVRSLVGYNGDLYAGIGNSTNDGEVWRYRSGTWTQIGGDSLNSGWTNVVEEITSFSPYKGKLYVGLGNTQNVDASVWRIGNNRFLQSTTTSFDTSWRHVAATYNGSTMKIHLNGVEDASQSASVTMEDTASPLLIGAGYAGRETGRSQGYFSGLIDEARISNTARTTFTTTPYSADGQTVRPAAAVGTSGIKNWETFAATETLNGGTLNFRLSDDAGATWKYWSGSAWVTSASISEVNDESTINTNIPTFPVTSSGLLWQAILDGDGNQQVTLNTVTIEATSDTTAPTAPDTLTALSSSSGTAISTDTWYNHTGPYFSWTGAADTGGSGIAGYYVYFGTDNTADPQTAGTFQAGTNYTAASLTSGTTYYLRIRSRDNAQNVSSIWAPFIYKFDSVGPTNPTTVSVSPGGYSATNDFTFSWPAGSDSSSGIQYYQYKTGASSGALSDWQNTASTSINIPSAAYQTDANTFYLRTVDNAGNTSNQITATYYFGGDGPTAPQFLSVTPSSNTTNSFAFSWQAPATFSGNASELTYCYTVNTLPTANSCTFTSAGATSLSASSFATQVGLNTFYLVAKNPATAGGAINYGAYTSVTFTANTSAPGIPLNIDIGDISIKSTETWRLALTWNAPSDVGSGVSSYKILRSTDNSTFTEVASSTGTSYVDTELDQVEYYYKVQACDSVDNCGAATTVVSGTPTGKFTEAASLTSGPTASSVTTKKATITWTTGRESDSKIQYGTSPGNYFTSEPSNSTQKTSHTIELTNLQPGTTYYYKAKWTDEDGNTGTSSEKSFITEAAPAVSEVKVTNIGLTQALINFRVKGASSVEVLFGETTAFGGLEKITTSKVEGDYTVQVEGLKDGTKYYYKINAIDEEGSEYEGTTLDFETLPRPRITNVRIQQVKGTAQPTVLISWTTNTEVSSIVTYYPQGRNSESRDEISLEPKKEHRLTIRGLNPQTGYELVVKGRDKQGNEGLSDPQRFTTATDTRNPVISDLRVQGSTQRLQNGQEQVVQLVISWNSDEPSTTQVEYGEGTGNNYPFKTQEDSNLKSNHLVVISNLSPSKVYHLRAVSKDSAGNIGYSQDNVTITPKETDSALELVLTNLRQIFGFLGDFTQ